MQKIMIQKIFLLLFCTLLLPIRTLGADLVLAEKGVSPYQIVIPDQAAGNDENEIVDRWLLMTGKLIEAAFRTNGFEIAVVRESAKIPEKPSIYLGPTDFARKNGLRTDFEDWTYQLKVVGQDLAIVGADRSDPRKTIRGTKTPLALLGTVKGACDFLRQYVGVRFLFMNMTQSQYATHGDGIGVLEGNKLAIDTRSIAFSPMPRIAIPTDLDLQKTPMLRACADSDHETFYAIANNFFPLLSSVQGATVSWQKVIPRTEYGKDHPEYFALMPDGRRACEYPVKGARGLEKLCPTHPEVQALMVQEVERLIQIGNKTIVIAPPDAYHLCYCNCDRCIDLFGGRAESWGEITLRGSTGKLWQAYFGITERLRKQYPEVRIVLWDYQDTPIASVREFPENVIPQLQFGKQSDFDRLQGITIPAGICGLEETFTGFGIGGPYLPERTPEHVAGLVQSMAQAKIQWTRRDGSMGYVRGLQAPAYYVYGRMMDDPSADWRGIFEEFCTAAFGDVAPTMTRFYDGLHEQIALYSDFFGVFMPAWDRKYGRSQYRDNKWHVMSMYPPEYCAAADALLTSAERQAKDPDVKARLHLIRIEFDYLSDLSRIFHLHSAWLLNPSLEFLNPLVDAIDAWRERLTSLAGGTARNNFKPLDDWPEMRPFNSHFFSHAALEGGAYQQRWNTTCLNWDTGAIRSGVLKNQYRLSVPLVMEAPGLDGDAWEQAPEQVLRIRNDMPFRAVRTTFKVLRDRDHLYVRLDCLNPADHPENLPKIQDERDVFKQEYVELGIQPVAGGAIYRFAGNPSGGVSYDSAWTVGAGKLKEDVTWKGRWAFDSQTTDEKGTWNLGSRIWTTCFRIPFAELGGASPAIGETWGFNVARNRNTSQYLIWYDAQSVTDPQALGMLEF